MNISPHPQPNKTTAYSILIVEDEPMLAFFLEETLLEVGFAIAGVVGRLEPALLAIESGDFDAAILDANLAGVSAGPAALALASRGLPFIVVSGYLRAQQPSEFAGAICLSKPCGRDDLIQALYSILKPARVATPVGQRALIPNTQAGSSSRNAWATAVSSMGFPNSRSRGPHAGQASGMAVMKITGMAPCCS